MQRTFKKICTMMLALVALAAGSGTALADGWTITDLGVLTTGGMSYATGINNNGQVVGWSAGNDTTTGTTAFIWDSANKMQSLGTSGAATGINSAGQVVGYSKDASGAYQAFLWSGGSPQSLASSYAGKNSSAYAINSSGLVGGTIQTNVEDAQHKYTNYLAATWSGSTVTALSSLQNVPYDRWGGPVSQVYSINDNGVKVGKSSFGAPAGDDNGDPASHAVLWSADGTIKDLGTLYGCGETISGVCASAAFGINAAGQVVGVSGDASNANLRPFLYSNGKMTDLGTLAGSTNGYAYAINNNGQAVGYSSDFKANDPASGTISESFTTATLWTINSDGTATPIDLNSLIAGSGWTLWGATGINDKGQIVGYGIQGEGPEATFHAFVMSPNAAPVPLPPALLLFGSGLAGLGALRRRFFKA
jgi:probable HAF family extracellular repeat protein